LTYKFDITWELIIHDFECVFVCCWLWSDSFVKYFQKIVNGNAKHFLIYFFNFWLRENFLPSLMILFFGFLYCLLAFFPIFCWSYGFCNCSFTNIHFIMLSGLTVQTFTFPFTCFVIYFTFWRNSFIFLWRIARR